MDTTSPTTGELEAILISEPNDKAVDETCTARRIAQRRDRHWTLLIITSVALFMSYLLSFNGQGSLSLGSVDLPPMCGSRIMLGINCPGCGLTRSFVAIAGGDFAKSLQFHRIGWLLWIAAVLQFPYRIYCLRELRGGLVERRWPSWFGNFLIAALIGNWFLLLLGW